MRKFNVYRRNRRLFLLLVFLLFHILQSCAGTPDRIAPVSVSDHSASPPSEVDTFLAEDGKELGYIAFRHAPRSDTALVYLHGIESHAAWFARPARLLYQRGMDVYALDRRGSGINRENRGFRSGHIDRYETLFSDIHVFIRTVAAGYRNLYLVGLSWGGKLAVGYGLAHPERISGLILITPGLRAGVDVNPFTKLNVLFSSRVSPTKPFDLPIRPEMFTTTPAHLAYIRTDPLRNRQATASFLIQSNELETFIDRHIHENRLPILVFLAGQDRIIDNPGVVRLLLGGEQELDLILYPEQTHSIQFDAPRRLVRDMVRWVNHRIEKDGERE